MNLAPFVILTITSLLAASTSNPNFAQSRAGANRSAKHRPANNSSLRSFQRPELWLYGFVDSNGKVVIEPKFRIAYEFVDGRARVMSDNLYGYVDTRGRPLVPARYRRADDCSEGLARVTIASGEYGYIDPRGAFVIPARRRHPSDVYARDLSFHDGLALFWENGRWGYLDRRGRVAIKPLFEMASQFSEGLAMVKFAGEEGVGFIDRTGKPAFAGRFAEARDFSEGLAVVAMYVDDKLLYGYIDRSGEYVTEIEFTHAGDLRKGLALVVKGPFVVALREPVIAACIPREGIPGGVPGGVPMGPGPQPEPGKAGYLDAKGKVAIPLRFEGAGEFSDWLAPFEKGGLWGFIDVRGEVVIPAKFLFVNEGFKLRIASVSVAGGGPGGERAVYIDRSGREILAPAPAP